MSHYNQYLPEGWTYDDNARALQYNNVKVAHIWHCQHAYTDDRGTISAERLHVHGHASHNERAQKLIEDILDDVAQKLGSKELGEYIDRKVQLAIEEAARKEIATKKHHVERAAADAVLLPLLDSMPTPAPTPDLAPAPKSKWIERLLRL